jgi:plasmid stabilization system protein ParE
MAVARPERRPGLRMFPGQTHLIFYQLAGDDIEIVRILRASRDVEALLRP